MKKISTLYKKNPDNLSIVIDEISEENKWVFENGIPTRKFDGTSTSIIENELYKRYDVKKNRKVPLNAIPCQEADKNTGHWPHWVKCDRNNPADKYHFEAFDKLLKESIITDEFNPNKFDGTYELCGPKILSNPEKIEKHKLIKHGVEVLHDCVDFSFDGLKEYLSKHDIEGIVFHEKNGNRMCKIRKCDFNIKR